MAQLSSLPIEQLGQMAQLSSEELPKEPAVEFELGQRARRRACQMSAKSSAKSAPQNSAKSSPQSVSVALKEEDQWSDEEHA